MTVELVAEMQSSNKSSEMQFLSLMVFVEINNANERARFMGYVLAPNYRSDPVASQPSSLCVLIRPCREIAAAIDPTAIPHKPVTM